MPTCIPCAAAGAHCVLSDRLVVQRADCECDSLRSQLSSIQLRLDSLLQENELLQAQARQIPVIIEPTSRSSQYPNSSDLSSTLPLSNQVRVSDTDKCQYNRILQPTFDTHTSGRRHPRLGSAWDLWQDEAVASDPIPNSSVELEQEVDDDELYRNLADVFFDYRWPYLPVLHQPTFMAEHLEPFLAGTTTNAVTPFMINIVCAIAAAEKSWMQNGNSHSHRQFFSAAAQDLGIVMKSDDLACVQCLLLLCMYGHNELGSVNMWYTSGLALRLAIGLDLHRKETQSDLPLLQAEMKKRLFWSAFVVDCSMACNMGRPLGIHVSDITVPLPLQLTDQQLENPFFQHSTEHESISLPTTKDTSTFIHIIKLRKINSAIYRTFHSPGNDLPEPESLAAIRTLYFTDPDQWLMTSPRYPRAVCTFQSLEWFQIAFHHAVVSLYRPSRAMPMPSLDHLRICTDSAIGLISAYSSLYARNRIKYTFVAIHSIFMAAVAMLYAIRASSSLRQKLTKPYTVNTPTTCPLSMQALNHRVIRPRVDFGATSAIAMGPTTVRAPIPKPATIRPAYRVP